MMRVLLLAGLVLVGVVCTATTWSLRFALVSGRTDFWNKRPFWNKATVGAKQGLLVCWGGFTKPTTAEAKAGHFSIRLWDSTDLVKAIYHTYERLPAEIKAELPLQRVWMFVPEASGESTAPEE